MLTAIFNDLNVYDRIDLEWFNSRIEELIRNFRQIKISLFKYRDMMNLKEDEEEEEEERSSKRN